MAFATVLHAFSKPYVLCLTTWRQYAKENKCFREAFHVYPCLFLKGRTIPLLGVYASLQQLMPLRGDSPLFAQAADRLFFNWRRRVYLSTNK